MRRQGFHPIVYVDNFVGCEASLAHARQAFECLHAIFNHLRLAPDKCMAPAPRLVWLRFEVCLERMTIHLPDDKLPPTLYDLAQYIAHLHRELPSLASIANTYSCTHAWVREAGVDPAPSTPRSLTGGVGGRVPLHDPGVACPSDLAPLMEEIYCFFRGRGR